MDKNTAKYGDNFVYLKLDPEKGIMGGQQLPNIEIERLERGMKSAPSQYGVQQPSGESNEEVLKFKWKVKDMEFNTWEIAHFRLLGDDRKLPYELRCWRKPEEFGNNLSYQKMRC